jgi:D-3-phosphoglycerate dehydrogenase
VDAEAIAKCPDLKVIGRPGAGYDSIDEPAATAAGIPIVLAPGVNSRSVAEHTLAMMFAMSKNLLEGHNGTAAGEFYKTRNLGKISSLRTRWSESSAWAPWGSIGQSSARESAMKTAASIPS